MKKFLKRFLGRQSYWSIGIYSGVSPYCLNSPKDIKNPVLTADDVTDRKALFVADPFMICEHGKWYMFFEVFNQETGRGEIGLAISKNCLSWIYQRVVISESFHLSYPYVFKFQDSIYMIPESRETKAIRLYKAVSFPYRWEFVKNLLTAAGFVDSSIFYYKDVWWLFTCSARGNDVLKLFHANNLMGSWFEHPASPIVKGNAHIARCGGRVLVLEDKIIRYAQDDHPIYGGSLSAFEIIKLNTKEYEESGYQHNPVLRAGCGKWNKMGMHNIDPHCLGKNEWIACVDGYHASIRLRKV